MKPLKKYYTDFLFTNSSFLIGSGSTLNIVGGYFDFNYSNSNIDADSIAIRYDWGMTANDILEAKKEFKRTFKPSE